jgi:tripartite-type tricarboxylate transporter receptor subunit TctC
VLYCDSPLWATNPHLTANMTFDPLKDLAPVIQTSRLPLYLTVRSSFPASTVAQLIAHIKQHPGKFAYASNGSGSLHHLTAEVFKQMAGIDVLHVPYKGVASAALALVSGDVQVSFLSYTSTAQFVAADKLRIIAISTAQRSSALPNVPTVAESGVPGFDMYSALGALVAAGTPRELVAKLNSGIAAAAAQPDVAKKMAGFGVVNVTGSTPEQFGAMMRVDYEKFGKLVKLTGARME